jgi:type I restriction enzyme S subunit
LIEPAAAPFLHLFLLAETGGRKQLIKAAYGAGKPGLNLDNVKDLRIPVFSRTEQRQIVQEIESRLSVCDKLAETIDTSLKQAESLRQSILKKAFTGRLLTPAERTACRHAPDYRPAAELVKTIKAETQ